MPCKPCCRGIQYSWHVVAQLSPGATVDREVMAPGAWGTIVPMYEHVAHAIPSPFASASSLVVNSNIGIVMSIASMVHSFKSELV